MIKAKADIKISENKLSIQRQKLVEIVPSNSIPSIILRKLEDKRVTLTFLFSINLVKIC